MKFPGLRVIAWCALGLLCVLSTGVAADEAQRKALQFDGKGDYVTAKLKAPLDADLTLEAWICTAATATLQERIMALSGPQGSLQVCINNGRFVIDNEGGPERGIVSKTVGNDGVWHHVIIKRYEKTTYALNIDGVSVGSCTGTTPVYDALYLGTAPGKPSFQGYIDEVRVYNRCLTEAEGYDNYAGEKPIVTDGLVGWWKLDGDVTDSVGGQNGVVSGAPQTVPGRGKALFNKPRISSSFYADAGKVSVDVNAKMMGDFPPEAAWEVVLLKPNGEELKKQVVPLLSGSGGGAARTNALGLDEITLLPGALSGVVNIPTENAAPGVYEVQVRILGAQGKPLGDASTEKVTLTERPAWVSKVKILNNLVWELLNAPAVKGQGAQFTFTNPREGWVFFATTASGELAEGDRAEVILDSFPQNKNLILHAAKKELTQEAMRFLPAGEHRLTVSLKGKAALSGLVVRAIPELAFDEYLQNHNVIKEFPPRDLAFMKRIGILQNLTTLMVHGGDAPPPYWKEWHDAGKRWVQGISMGDDKEIAAAVDRWLSPLKNDWIDGTAVDEFMAFNAFRTEAVTKLLADPRLKGKWFYPYTCSPMPQRGGEVGEPARLLGAVVAAGQRPLWERYLQEQADEGASWQVLNVSLRDDIKNYWRPMNPEALHHTVLTLGNFLSSPPANLNAQPGVDVKVWMDMQYNLIANDPLFFGLGGLMDWTTGYADEENIRWTARLYRHYAIEGRTDMLSPKYGFKFKLTHIQNADFDDGIKGWEVGAAEQGSVDGRSFNGFSALQGRYPETTQGNNFLRMKRSVKAPNTVSQTIKNLTPGKLYSVKMFAADYGEMMAGKSERQKLAVGLTITGAEVLAEKSIQSVVASRWLTAGAFTDTNPLWGNYFYRVFRATGTEAKLTISDWLTDTVLGGPAGQEMACNFVEVQPYLED